MDIGIIGTGWVADKHLDALAKIAGVRVTALAGATRFAPPSWRARPKPRAGSLRCGTIRWSCSARPGSTRCSSFSPPHLHGDLERAIARSVPAALIEKPIATDLKTAEAAAEAFDKAGTLVSVGYMNRYRKTTAKVRELMAASAPVTIHGWWITEMPPPLWWRSKEQSGGQFVEQCTHLVDLARWIGGEIAEVSAFTTRGFVDDVPEYGVDDALTANVRFASGALGNFTTGCFPQGTASTGRGVDGVGMTFTSRTTQCTLTGWSLDLEWRNNAGGGQSLASDEDIFVVQDSALVQAAATGNRTGILSTYADGVRTLAVTLAAEESARTRRIVSL